MLPRDLPNERGGGASRKGLDATKKTVYTAIR